MRRFALGLILLVGMLLGGWRPTAAISLRVGTPAPEITGAPWINSAPLTMAGLRGQVVLVEFWTYGCSNCKNTIPQLRDWHAKYQTKGLTIVGVHAPEFLWEKPFDKVVAATKELGVAYPVVQDNDFAIWKRYANRYWPAAALVDKKGIVRFIHIGEGAYVEMERRIRELLAEP